MDTNAQELWLWEIVHHFAFLAARKNELDGVVGRPGDVFYESKPIGGEGTNELAADELG